MAGWQWLTATREIDLFEKQMAYEKLTAQTLRAMGAKTKNSVPKLLFKGIELDTTKHAHMYATLIDMASGATISKVEHYEMKKQLEQHVENEKIMLLQAEKIARHLTDRRMKPLLKVILADERRHHKTLMTLLKTIAVEEKVSEDDWYDYLNRWANYST
jgi:rubrerythrin